MQLRSSSCQTLPWCQKCSEILLTKRFYVPTVGIKLISTLILTALSWLTTELPKKNLNRRGQWKIWWLDTSKRARGYLISLSNASAAKTSLRKRKLRETLLLYHLSWFFRLTNLRITESWSNILVLWISTSRSILFRSWQMRPSRFMSNFGKAKTHSRTNITSRCRED